MEFTGLELETTGATFSIDVFSNDVNLFTIGTDGVIDTASVDSASVVDDSIIDDDINSSAAIIFSKMVDLTNSRALVSDGSGDVSVSSGVTAGELEFLSEVTSDIQAQLDSKATSSGDFSGNLTRAGAVSVNSTGAGNTVFIETLDASDVILDSDVGVETGTIQIQGTGSASDLLQLGSDTTPVSLQKTGTGTLTVTAATGATFTGPITPGGDITAHRRFGAGDIERSRHTVLDQSDHEFGEIADVDILNPVVCLPGDEHLAAFLDPYRPILPAVRRIGGPDDVRRPNDNCPFFAESFTCFDLRQRFHNAVTRPLLWWIIFENQFCGLRDVHP